MTMAPVWKVRHVGVDGFPSWTRLFRGYCDFYEWPTSDDHQKQVWGWIHDDESVEALVAVEIDDLGREIDAPRGLAHLRGWVRPLRGVTCGYLDDLYVDPDRRGSGAVDALFSKMNDLALQRGWAIIRWTTAENNVRAQGAYDKVAKRTTWVTYDMTPVGEGAPHSS
jgi:ribosomal protein S18 acetylase RimI-like enzyme